MKRVLIVDDERSMREMLSIALDGDDFEVLSAEGGEVAVRHLEAAPVDIVVSDIKMPGMDGIELLRHVKETSPDTDVILITAHASTDSAIEALRLGAYDYVTKPFDVGELEHTVRRALERQDLRRENVLLKGELSEQAGFDELVGRSAAMRRVFGLIQRVKDTSSTVLISGESGTGKELVARAIHHNGARADRPFVTVNCAALPAQLLESELFGHVKGAFTGADRHHEGLFEAADGGTILLDEIGDMPLELQPKLLRVLEDRSVRRVGATTERPVDVRVLAATNQDLRAAFADGRFREDLFYRLNVIQIDLPPLRERGEDVPLLVRHFLERVAGEVGREISGLDPEAERLLQRHDWPGNVRELENAVRHAVTMAPHDVLTVDSLPASVRRGAGTGTPGREVGTQEPSEAEPAGAGPVLPEEGVDLDSRLDDLKRDYMREALRRAGGVQKRAAELLGMTFRSFRYYADKLDLGEGDPEK